MFSKLSGVKVKQLIDSSWSVHPLCLELVNESVDQIHQAGQVVMNFGSQPCTTNILCRWRMIQVRQAERNSQVNRSRKIVRDLWHCRLRDYEAILSTITTFMDTMNPTRGADNAIFTKDIFWAEPEMMKLLRRWKCSQVSS